MIKVTLVTVGTLKEDYLVSAAAEYAKRLGAFCAFTHENIREERVRDESSLAAIASALDAEGERILAKMPRDSYKIALCIEGKELSSEELAATLGDAIDKKGSLCFVIGSSHGLAENVKSACDIRLSMSRMTFPHQLARVMLLEAVYRSFTILAGKKYHK